METGEDAERYLRRCKQREQWCAEAAEQFGIAADALTRWERSAIARWHEEWGIGREMIEEALLRAGNKTTIRYVDGILRAWRAQGITTVSAARGQGQLSGSNILATQRPAPQQPAAPAAAVPVAAAVTAEAVAGAVMPATAATAPAAEVVATEQVVAAEPAADEPVAAVAEETVAEPVPAAVMETVEEDTFAPAETPEEAAEAAAEPAIILPDNYIEDAQAGVTVVEEIPSDADTAAADAATDAADNDKPTA